jgi:hypothetical protein
MPNSEPTRPANRIAAALSLAAGILFVSRWAIDQSTPVHLVVGALLIVAGFVMWRRRPST